MKSMAANTGRKAKPRALKIVEGNPGRRPIEEEVNFNRGIPTKPAELSPDASWLWDEIMQQMQGVGLLKPVDASSLEVVCETFARWREAVRMRRGDGMLSENSQGRVTAPWIGIEERAGKEFRAWCSEFGLTPAAEKNVSGADEAGAGAQNPFDGVKGA